MVGEKKNPVENIFFSGNKYIFPTDFVSPLHNPGAVVRCSNYSQVL